MFGLIFGSMIFCFVLERVAPGWRLPTVQTWSLRVVLVNLLQLAVVVLAGLTWDRWFPGASLFSLGSLPPLVGGLAAYFFATFVFYWWHRWRHENDILWRGFHQIHHSPQRLEVITSFYKHPLEMCVNSVLGAALVYAVLGLTPEGGAVYTLCTALGEFFYHTNVRTPRWVGYIFQRPEMHRIHHQYGRHKNNYGDIVWWDMLFGTYENPATWNDRCGFDDEKEQRLPSMLAFVDVHAVAPERAPAASAAENRGFSATRIIALVACAGVSGASIGARPLRACTSFGFSQKEGFLMAKNYDWMLGDGLVVALPRGRESAALVAPAFGLTDGDFTWTSQYKSMAFTQFGMGLTISGMNESGLVVETLVNATGTLSAPPLKDSQKALLSLQWVQYQLDTASSVDDVVASLDSVAVVQAFIPVHFLACDAGGMCAVIETDRGGTARVVRNREPGAPLALANRDYLLDARDVNIWSSRVPWPTLERSSAYRFRKVGAALADNRASTWSVGAAFNLLESVRMPITRWQIVWDLRAREAHWRHHDASGAAARTATSHLDDRPGGCRLDVLQAAPLGRAVGAVALSEMSRSQVNAITQPLLRRSLKFVEIRSKIESGSLESAIATMQLRQKCR